MPLLSDKFSLFTFLANQTSSHKITLHIVIINIISSMMCLRYDDNNEQRVIL